MIPALIVIAKEPLPGRSKTRLSPPLTPEAAARLAEASLADTLAAAAACPTSRRVLVLDGQPGDWLPPGFEVIPQRGEGLDERLANAFEDVNEPAVLVGMDTPQVGAALLADALRRLAWPGTDAVLGPAFDGGYWAIGLREPRRDLFLGVPMSSSDTYEAQLTRLRDAGLCVRTLVPFRDVDVMGDARAVAQLAPMSRFASVLATDTA